MAIRIQHHANVSRQVTLLDGLDVCPLKWRVCGCDLNRFVHEGMNHISNIEVHLKTRSGNVNIMCIKAAFVMISKRSSDINFLQTYNVYVDATPQQKLLSSSCIGSTQETT